MGWVTLKDSDGVYHHVLLDAEQGSHSGRAHAKTRQLPARDEKYLDQYYDAVAAEAKKHEVNPAFVLGVGAESGFASEGTYLRTGDAFGMTGGSTKHMTRAQSPEENVQEFFQNWGKQIEGTGDNLTAFIYSLEGRNSQGRPVRGWRVYNSYRPAKWEEMVRQGVGQMERDIPAYLSKRAR